MIFTECIWRGSLIHPNIIHFVGVHNPGGQLLLATSSSDGVHAREPYINYGKVPKYSNV